VPHLVERTGAVLGNPAEGNKKMPSGTTMLRRTLLCVVALNVCVAAPTFAAQPQGVQDSTAAAPGELAIDRRLAEQYGGPALTLQPTDAAAPLAGPSAFDEEAARRLEQEIDAALAEAATQKSVKPKVRPAAPRPWSTAALVSGALLLFALVCVMLTLAVRELRKDAKQRRRSYRRRVRRRQPVDSTAISAG
jgi:hypothetical protein